MWSRHADVPLVLGPNVSRVLLPERMALTKIGKALANQSLPIPVDSAMALYISSLISLLNFGSNGHELL
jgi:hypothetical protein